MSDVIERAAEEFDRNVSIIEGTSEFPAELDRSTVRDAAKAAIRLVLEDQRNFAVTEDEPRTWFGSEWQLNALLLKAYARDRLDIDLTTPEPAP